MPDTHTETVELDDGTIIDTHELNEWYQELTALRDSGDINMMGAPRWLVDNFDMSKSTAQAIFKSWSESLESYESIHND
jgi:hypothetical protein